MTNAHLHEIAERYITKVNSKCFHGSPKLLQLIIDLARNLADYQHPVSHQTYASVDERGDRFKIRSDVKSILRICAAFRPDFELEALKAIYATFTRPNSERDFSIPRFVGLARVVLKDGRERQAFHSFEFTRLAEEHLRVKILFKGREKTKRLKPQPGSYNSARSIGRNRATSEDIEERNW
jgi:hypothetical protein